MSSLIWEEIKGYPRYLVSNSGIVVDLHNNVEMTQSSNARGYLVVTLVNTEGRKTHQVHRVVLAAFVFNPENKPQVNHKDAIKSNNWVDNLEWATQQENMAHAKKLRLHRRGDNHPGRKLNSEQVAKIRELHKTGLYKQQNLAEKFSVHHSTISLILLKKRWK